MTEPVEVRGRGVPGEDRRLPRVPCSSPARRSSSPGPRARLDVMGGIADYSGSLVLQWPIREATWRPSRRSPEPGLRIVSLAVEDGHEARSLDPRLARPRRTCSTGGYEQARHWFGRDPRSHWAAYVAGVLVVLARERGLELDRGLRILIESHVPEGKGVSSSAALEVATMQAVTGLLGVTLEGAELARLCQMAENYVVGAPAGSWTR